MITENMLKIKLENVSEVMSLIKEAIAEMESHNIYQWDEVYPDYNTILTDIQAETMFGVFKNEELAGIVVLNKEQSPEYSSIKWESDNANPLVMHRLCVRPKFQRQGIAKLLLNFSEQLAVDSNCKSIRLDAFYGNQFALNLYGNNGYKKKGTVTFRKGDFYCYEKIIS